MTDRDEPPDTIRRGNHTAPRPTERRPLPEGSEHGSSPAGAPLSAETRRRDAAAASTQHLPLDAGTVIRRRYVLQRLIGSGGMGQVWKAKDLVSEQAKDPNPFVAIKLLNANFEADPASFVSLQRETRKSQELAHPNLATVYAFDTDDGGSGRAF